MAAKKRSPVRRSRIDAGKQSVGGCFGWWSGKMDRGECLAEGIEVAFSRDGSYCFPVPVGIVTGAHLYVRDNEFYRVGEVAHVYLRIRSHSRGVWPGLSTNPLAAQTQSVMKKKFADEHIVNLRLALDIDAPVVRRRDAERDLDLLDALVWLKGSQR